MTAEYDTLHINPDREHLRLFPGSILVMALLVLALATSMLTSPDAAAEESAVTQNPYVKSYPLPNDGVPRNLVEGGGDLWFTAPGENAIGRLVYTSTVDYTYTFFSIPTVNSDPYDLAWDGANVWFTERAGNNLGKLDPDTGAITEYTVPTEDSEPTGITVHGSGLIWFAQRAGNKLASFDPATQDFVEYDYPNAGALPEDVTTRGSSRFIWFTAPGVQRLVGYNRDTSEFKDVPTAQPGLSPYTPNQVVVDNQGNPWVSTTEGLLGRHSVATFQFFRWYQVAPADAHIDGLYWQALGNDTRIWFTVSNTGHAGQLSARPSGSLLSQWRFPVAGASSNLAGITRMPDGSVWMAAGGEYALLQWSPPFASSVHLPIVAKSD